MDFEYGALPPPFFPACIATVFQLNDVILIPCMGRLHAVDSTRDTAVHLASEKPSAEELQQYELKQEEYYVHTEHIGDLSDDKVLQLAHNCVRG